MQQKNKIMCPKHPKYEITSYININPSSKSSRFYCNLCFLNTINEGTSSKEFQSLREVLYAISKFVEDFDLLLKQGHNDNSMYTKNIKIYKPLFENDIDDLITNAKNQICEGLENLRTNLKPYINILAQLKLKLNEATAGWSKLVGYTKFIQEYEEIQKSDKDATSVEWKNIESTLEQIIQESQTQQNDEFKVICTSLQQQYLQLLNESAKGLPQVPNLQEIQLSLSNSILKCLKLPNIQTNLSSDDFLLQIEKTIGKGYLNSQLLYKLGQDAKDHSLVWQRINGKSNTLMFIKLETNEIIGAYTPAIWNSNPTQWVTDNTGTSFLFSVTKNQIYPLYQNQAKAIYCKSDYLPTFGSSHDLYLTKNSHQLCAYWLQLLDQLVQPCRRDNSSSKCEIITDQGI